ncbi:hypothetical protein NUU61_008384 [Penicillium alfredii]|uniref:Transcription factor IIIC subunit delta N-term-domain-containing protein n=1 Tax=Penicillium alfredii TaxID=1506179 RepID=A0A9W9JZZ9_9EURO|nr:uncharacterized protein NUU61_008384 [Penicillium alfredii]KAJ5087077.1 hypothetical protein NUU61_008384 [Penicillium alfredii]
MPIPVEVSSSPSCHDALAWSSDGELAVATGEYVHILTPKSPDNGEHDGTADGWNLTRIRVDVFTVAEWSLIYPQKHDDFSLSIEQSPSTVVSLSWSPPGVAKFRRCVLAVLTSNLLLSLWEPLGLKGQWARVAVINHALHPQLAPSIGTGGREIRKARIRSFEWFAPLKFSGATTDPTYESRWGIPLLIVANDVNDVILLQVRRLPVLPTSSKPFKVDILALYSLDNLEGQYGAVYPGSLFKQSLKIKLRVLSIACGPWVNSPAGQGSVCSAIAMVAAAFGTKLHTLKATVTLREPNDDEEGSPRYEATAELTDHPLCGISQKWAKYQVTGPLEWLQTAQSPTRALVACINAGCLTISIPHSVYSGTDSNVDSVEIREWPFYEPEADGAREPQPRHMEPISAMTTSTNADTCTLHLGTPGGLGLATKFQQHGDPGAMQIPHWKQVVEDFRERYDLDRDLGGLTVARIWGLACHNGVTAALFTRHPTNMVEYRVAADDRSTIIFSSDDEASPVAHKERGTARDRREVAIRLVLSNFANSDESDPKTQHLVYHAACCAIVDEHSESLQTQARQSLERLVTVTGADLTAEIAQCHQGSASIPAKSLDQLTGPGGHLFEQCEICNAGIGWFSVQEAQCMNGHLFTRCGLTFLAIQEPGISKFCSSCRTEYLDEEAIARTRGVPLAPSFRRIFEAFDTCLYCDGKFQHSV